MKTFSLALVASLAAGAASAADYWWPNADGGDWSELSNWKQGGEAVTTLPGESDTTYFCPGAYTIRLTEDVRVGKTNLENQDCYTLRDVTFDLNGHAFVAVNGHVCSGDRSHTLPAMVFRNGTVSSEDSVAIGKANSDAWTGSVTFDQVTVNVTNNIAIQGAYPYLCITNGAKVTCARFGGYVSRLGKTVDISGPETEVTCALFQANGPHRMRVANGAWMTVGTENVAKQDALLVGGFEQDLTDKTGGRLVVDNAVITNIGASTSIRISPGRLHDCVLSLTNNARVVSFGYCYVGGGQEINGICYPCYSNRVEILDGSVLDMNGLSSGMDRLCDGMVLGAKVSGKSYGVSYGNSVYVKDGTYLGRFFMMGDDAVAADRPGFCATNNMLHIAGTRSLVKTIAEHYAGYSFWMRSGSILRFDIGKDGYENVPVQVAGTFKTSRPNNETYTAFNALSNKIVIAARDFCCAHPKEKVTLIQTAKDSTAAFQELIDNATFIGNRRGTLAIEDNGKQLVYTAPDRSGATIFVR